MHALQYFGQQCDGNINESDNNNVLVYNKDNKILYIIEIKTIVH